MIRLPSDYALAVPRRVDIEEPPLLRFFIGKLAAKDNWGRKLAEAFQADFGTEL